MPDSETIHLTSKAFGDDICGLGSQLTTIIEVIDTVRSDLRWYVADVDTSGVQGLPDLSPLPIEIGTSETLLDTVKGVEQFYSGVFAGVPNSIVVPRWRPDGLWTEDPDAADIGVAIVEIRAFDAAYWIINTADPRLLTRFRELAR